MSVGWDRKIHPEDHSLLSGGLLHGDNERPIFYPIPTQVMDYFPC